MQTHYSADLHVDHDNVIGFTGRPVRNIEEMRDLLAQRWNENVDVDDFIWILGDFAMGKIAHSLPFIQELNGTKGLLTGNHDRCFPGSKKADEWEKKYLDAGFSEIRHGSMLVTIKGTLVVANHFPYHGDSHDEDRFVDRRPIDVGLWLLCGHVHNAWHVRDRQINVGVDVNDYAPISEDEIAEIMQSQ